MKLLDLNLDLELDLDLNLDLDLELDLELEFNSRYIIVYTYIVFKHDSQEIKHTSMVHYAMEAIIVGLGTLALGLSLSIGFMYTRSELRDYLLAVSCRK